MVKVSFTDEQMRNIIMMKEGGKTYDQLAEVLGVSPSTIKRNIRAWNKVNPPTRKTVDVFDAEIFKRMCSTAIKEGKQLRDVDYSIYFKAYYQNGRPLSVLAEKSGLDKDDIDRWVHANLTGMDLVHFNKLWENINSDMLF